MAKLQHLARLKDGVESWNAWRIEEPTPPDLSAAQLEDLDFGGFNFARSNLDSANLRGANLEGAAIAAARLKGADLTGAVLQGVNAMEADLSRVSLRDSLATEANFCRCNLTGASFARAELQATLFDEAWAILVYEDDRFVSVDFTGANLEGAQLLSARFDHAVFDDAVLSKAFLVGTSIRCGTFHGANLSSATLRCVLTETNFEGASLEGAELDRADLSWASLKQARFHGARLDRTRFADTNLQGAIGLEECVYRGPSSLDQRTYVRSNGLPAVFLRGCGWADWEIEAVKLFEPALTKKKVRAIGNRVTALRSGTAPQQHPLLITYWHEDGDFVGRLGERLDRLGLRYWKRPIDKTLDTSFEFGPPIPLEPRTVVVLSHRSLQAQWGSFLASAIDDYLERNCASTICTIVLDRARLRSQGPLQAHLLRTAPGCVEVDDPEDDPALASNLDHLCERLAKFCRTCGDG